MCGSGLQGFKVRGGQTLLKPVDHAVAEVAAVERQDDLLMPWAHVLGFQGLGFRG